MARRMAMAGVPGPRRRGPLAPRAAAAGPPPAAAASGLFRWAEAAGVKAPGLAPEDFAGLRGLVARRRLGPGDVLISVPRSLAFEVTTRRGKCPEEGLQMSSEAWNRQAWWVKMSLLLLSEKAKGPASERGEYLRSLPREHGTPLHWAEADVAELQASYIVAGIAEQRREWTRIHRELVPACSGLDVPWEDFVWAAETVRSRSFSGPYEGSDYEERLQQLVFLAALVGVYLLSGAGPASNALNGTASVLCFLVLKDLYTQKNPNSLRYAMCPVIDLCNHTSRAESDVSYEYFLNSFSLTTNNLFEPGDQVYISYGKRSNDELLQYYGFVSCLPGGTARGGLD